MTVSEYLASGLYRDALALDGEAYILPPGFTVSRTPMEKANVVTMADGRKRQDIVRRWEKVKFEWEALLEAGFGAVKAMAALATQAQSRTLYLRKAAPASAADYDTFVIDVVSMPQTNHKYRGGIFVYSGVTIEME